jgi:hypothetical protein
MLAHHAQLDAGVARGFDHAARGFQIGRHGLLHLDVLLRLGATLHRLQAEFGEGANIHVIDARVPAQVLVIGNELAAVALGEGAGAVGVKVGASHHLVADVGVRSRVFVSDGAGADDADPHASYCDMRGARFRLAKM